jgi:16S rRNA (adenine1518-N6/adenine1519-N6)-dimethyltransferase
MERNDVDHLPCDEGIFFTVVKTAFNQRRKTLHNALKASGLFPAGVPGRHAGRRAEQLSVADFVDLAQAAADKASA